MRVLETALTVLFTVAWIELVAAIVVAVDAMIH